MPVVRGGGYTVEGWGRTRIRTDLVRDGEVWLRDHQTGRDHHIALGSEYPPMRVGHGVSMLWVNGEHYATANHHTGVMETYFLSDAAGPYRRATHGCLALILALLVGPAVFFLALFTLNAAFPAAWPALLHLVAPAHHWTRPELNGLCYKLPGWGAAASAVVAWVGYRRTNRRAGTHHAGMQEALDAAVDQHLRGYQRPDTNSWHLA